jgi:hypothetical protein
MGADPWVAPSWALLPPSWGVPEVDVADDAYLASYTSAITEGVVTYYRDSFAMPSTGAGGGGGGFTGGVLESATSGAPDAGDFNAHYSPD